MCYIGKLGGGPSKDSRERKYKPTELQVMPIGEHRSKTTHVKGNTDLGEALQQGGKNYTGRKTAG